MSQKMIPAYAYLRVSGADQVEGDGYERQLLAITTTAAKLGYEITEIFREQITGTSDSSDRPEWVRMIAKTIDTNVKIVMVEKLDRLARMQGIQEYIIHDLNKRGITIIPADDPTLMSDDPMRVLFRQLIGAIAQYEKTMIVLKLRGARQRMKQNTGRCEGRKPFGHRPDEVHTLDMMHKYHSTGMTYTQIADRLNQRGMKSRTGGKWYSSSVRMVLLRQR